MSKEIVAVHPSTLTERMTYAKALATADLLPPAYRNKPGNVLLAVEHGQALGISPMTAIQGVHIIQGKPTLSADLMAALVRRAGHRLRVSVDAVPSATAQLIRSDDPDWTFEATWDMARAEAAGLLGKDTWRQHPTAMLKARAISEVIREGASEVLHGLIYTPEELGGEEPAEGADVTEAPAAPQNVNTETGEIHEAEVVEDGPAPQADGGEPVSHVADAAADEEPLGSGGETSPSSPPMISSQQTKLLGVLMKEAELTERATALAYAANVIGREIGSRNELTRDEASRVIEALKTDADVLAGVTDAPADDPNTQWDQPDPKAGA